MVDCRAVLTDERGQVIFERKNSLKTPEPFHIRGGAEDLVGTLHKMLWQNCQSWGSSVGVPSGMVRTPTGVKALPQPTNLTGDQ